MFSDPSINIAKFGLSEGMKVVDLGAGSGFYSLEASRRVGTSGRVYAVDVQKDLLDRLRSHANEAGIHNIEIIWGNAEKIGGTKLREAIADRVIASNILFQVEKPEDFSLEIKRILKPGGKVMVVDWSEVSPMGPSTVVSAIRARTIFEKAGFKMGETFSAGDHHYGLIFIRS